MIAHKLSMLIVAGVVLAACASQLDRARRSKPVGDNFSRALSSGYLRLAENEQSSQHYKNADQMAHQAIRSAKGDHPSPAQAGAKQNELKAARARLIKSLTTNARVTTPETAAEAQVAYECWILKSAQKDQNGMVTCRRRFETAMGLIPGSATPDSARQMISNDLSGLKVSTQPVVGPKDPGYKRPMPVRPSIDAPDLGTAKQKFMIYFEFDSAVITPEAQDVLTDVIAELGSNSYKLMRIEGHADRAGPAQYNLVLSEKRARAINIALNSALSSPPKSATQGFGESRPAKSTPDGIREVLNRRAEIYLF